MDENRQKDNEREKERDRKGRKEDKVRTRLSISKESWRNKNILTILSSRIVHSRVTLPHS